MQQSKIVNNHEVFWDVDLNAAAGIQKWLKKFPLVFTKDVNEMKKFFPRWLLTISKADGTIICCEYCNNTLVPTHGEIICVACQRKIKVKGTVRLAWTGHLPTLVSGRDKFLRKSGEIPDPAFPLVELNGNIYLLVPVVIVYPVNGPLEEPHCYYTQQFIQFLYKFNGSYIHLLGGGRMCLFAYDQWNSITIREVIQQRVVNHLISIIKIADGMDPQKAFIGKGH
jgi:hypothetical protein